MRVKELKNILKSFDDELEIFACSEDSLWRISESSLRETTLYETDGGDLVEKKDYEKEDGAVIKTHEVLLMDLDI